MRRRLHGRLCFINNAAVAAQWFRDQGAAKVAMLDVDYHHGNGTQEIFYSGRTCWSSICTPTR